MTGHGMLDEPDICRLIATIIAMNVVITVGSAAYAQHRLKCPREAPAGWGLPKTAPLDQIAILSQPLGQPIDDSSPPSLVPDHGFARGNVWHKIWLMGDEPGWARFIDCRYRGSTRILRG